MNYGVWDSDEGLCNTHQDLNNRCPGAYVANTDDDQDYYSYQLNTIEGANTDIFQDEVIEIYLDLDNSPPFVALRKVEDQFGKEESELFWMWTIPSGKTFYPYVLLYGNRVEAIFCP